RLLAGVDRFERRAEGHPAAAPHLDEDHRRAVERHQVDLPRTAAVVARHDRVVMCPEEGLRHRLAPPPELAPPVHGRREYPRPPTVATAARRSTTRARCASVGRALGQASWPSRARRYGGVAPPPPPPPRPRRGGAPTPHPHPSP